MGRSLSRTSDIVDSSHSAGERTSGHALHRTLPRGEAERREVDAICSRNRYTNDPAPVLDELRAATAHRPDVLAEAAGTWLGYFEDDYTATLCAALRTLPDVEPWIEVGRFRRSMPDPSTPAILGHSSAVDLPLYVNAPPPPR